MENGSLNFEDILNSTVHMVRSNWKVSVCLFLQLDDQHMLAARAGDGIPTKRWRTLSVNPKGTLLESLHYKKARIVQLKSPLPDDLAALLKPFLKSKTAKFFVVPVYGQARVLGALLMGPFPKPLDKTQEQLLRNAGTLCAVLAAYGRLYDWMSTFLPQMNHELRTPLTAVQGSLGMVLGGMFGTLDSEVRAMLEMAHSGCARTIRAIEDHLTTQNTPQADEKKK